MDDPIQTLREVRAPLEDAQGGMTLEGAGAARYFASVIEPFAAPGFQVRMVGGSMEQSKEGAKGVEELWVDFMEPWQTLRIESEDMLLSPDGSAIVELVRLIATPHGTSGEIDQAAAAVWRLESGLLSAVEFHLDRDEARRAGGITAGPGASA